jgi:hypothetical protein
MSLQTKHMSPHTRHMLVAWAVALVFLTVAADVASGPWSAASF